MQDKTLQTRTMQCETSEYSLKRATQCEAVICVTHCATDVLLIVQQL